MGTIFLVIDLCSSTIALSRNAFNSLSKSRISLFNAHLALFDESMINLRSHTYSLVSIVIYQIDLGTRLGRALPWRCRLADQTNKPNHCGTGEECECEELTLEKRLAISMQGNVLCKL